MGLIRFILACGVLLGHSQGILGYTPLSGNLAVQVFYIISGFYMSLILNKKYIGPKSTFLFYSNRALKIYPLYWAVLFFRLLWAIYTLKKGYPSTLDHYKGNWPMDGETVLFFVFTNVFIFGLDVYFFLGIGEGGNLFFSKNAMILDSKVYDMAFNFIAWTISIELIFYLFAPFIVRRKSIYIVVLFLASLAIRFYIIRNGFDHQPWNYMFLPTQIMFFMAGILSYKIYKYLLRYQLKTFLLFSTLLVLICVILFYPQVFPNTYYKECVLFLIVTLSIPNIFRLTKSSKIDQQLGNLSYPIYISQIIFLKVLPAKSIPKIVDLGFTTLVVTIGFSLLLNYTIAQPIEKFRQKRALQLK